MKYSIAILLTCAVSCVAVLLASAHKTPNTRYFFVAFAGDNCKSGYYSFQANGFPSEKTIIGWVEKDHGKMHAVITNIYEFKNETDFNNFRR